MGVMLVEDLIAKLNDLVEANPRAAEWVVVSEGCDCDGEAGGIDWAGPSPDGKTPGRVTVTRA